MVSTSKCPAGSSNACNRNGGRVAFDFVARPVSCNNTGHYQLSANCQCPGRDTSSLRPVLPTPRRSHLSKVEEDGLELTGISTWLRQLPGI